MEALRRNMVAVLMAMMMAMGCLVTVAVGEQLHRVGDSQGWSPSVNYTHWTTCHQFYVGDWLYFGFDKRYYNVLEVNETSYESCNDKDFIKNITRGGRDVFQLTEVRPYYFLAGFGYCFQGMKVVVFVSETAPPAPAPAPAGTISGASDLPNPTAISSIFTALLLNLLAFLVSW